MKSYVVGGAVRDRLLGLPVSDRDHVVVGATVDDMLAAGYRPVGRDFPVFLHPVTHEEYALARTERKVAKGYAGFVFHADPTVTLAADLERRDLTINAIAEADDGRLIDPFGGQADLARRIFRHVGPAFVEDPVRALRVARFAARFGDFTIAAETCALMQTMTERGEIDALVPERVWQELERGLLERQPSRMFDVLRQSGALQRIAPEIDGVAATELASVVDRAADAGAPLAVRFAVIARCVGRSSDGAAAVVLLTERLHVPKALRELAVLAGTVGDELVSAVHRSDAAGLVSTMERVDAFRRADRFAGFRAAVVLSIADASTRQVVDERVGAAVSAAMAVDASGLARAVDYVPAEVARCVREARVAAVVAVIGEPR